MIGAGRRVLAFYSGVGGLTVLAAARAALPGAYFAYLADDAGFPYGRLAPAALLERIEAAIGAALAVFSADAVVIACNTASTLALPALRARCPAVPFVGTVPAIKPAAAASRSRLISVLATPATVARDYTHRLVAEFAAGCEVTLVGSDVLAVLAEGEMRGTPIDDSAMAREIAPAFVERAGRRTDQIVLACTHYPLLAERMARLAPWPVQFVDPAPAIARRLADVLGLARVGPEAGGTDSGSARDPGGPGLAWFTAGVPPAALSAALGRFGLSAAPFPGVLPRRAV